MTQARWDSQTLAFQGALQLLFNKVFAKTHGHLDFYREQTHQHCPLYNTWLRPSKYCALGREFKPQ